MHWRFVHRQSNTRTYTHINIRSYGYVRIGTHSDRHGTHTQIQPCGTHGGNGLFLHLCCTYRRLPLFLHHLLSTAQRVPLSRQFRVLHRRVCTQVPHKFYVQDGHKRYPERSIVAFFAGTSFPGVIQVHKPIVQSLMYIHSRPW